MSFSGSLPFAVTASHQGSAFFIVGLALLLGVILQILSHRVHIPAIVPLLIGGIIVGPEGIGLIDPRHLDPQMLKFIVSLAVAIILFEGGLGLDIDGFRQSPAIIRRLLTIGVVITWLATAYAFNALYQFPFSLSLVAGSLVIVTGPTVIQPILRRTVIKERLHHILHWESVLVDPIGIFIAILSLELLFIDVGGGGLLSQTLVEFGLRFCLGIAFGLVGGIALDFLLRNNRLEIDHVNITVLGAAIFLFGISDYILPESGLLTVAVTGFFLGYRSPPRLKQVTQFKKELTELSISVLFILLAANLSFDSFKEFLGDSRGYILLAVLLFIIRPLSIFICTVGRNLTIPDKLFLSWMAPRGIVAASMASLFALTLKERNIERADFIEAFVYCVIGASVIIQGSSVGLVARLTGVKAPKRKGWLIVGAHKLGREIAHFLKDKVGVNVFLIDTNVQMIKKAQQENIPSDVANATEKNLFERDAIIDIGNVLALTDNHHLNKVICQTWSEIIENENLWRWSPGHDDIDETLENQGHPVLTEINNPSLLSWDLINSKAHILSVEPEKISNHEQIKTLISSSEDQRISFFRDSEKTMTHKLILHRSLLDLVHLTRSEIIKVYQNIDRDTLLKNMVDDIAAIYSSFNREKLFQDLKNREESFPTAIGGGVAVPHTYCESLEESICAIARIPDGVDFFAHDKKPVHLVFLLASPPGDPDHHLKILGEIAALASDPKLVEQLISAPHASDVINFIESAEIQRQG